MRYRREGLTFLFSFPDYSNAMPPGATQIARIRLNRFRIHSSQTVHNPVITLLKRYLAVAAHALPSIPAKPPDAQEISDSSR